jgi:hypothetical protein
MQLFSFGKEYKIVTFDEFYKEFIDFPESHD